MDTANNPAGPLPVQPLPYKAQRTLEQRVERLERELRLWQAGAAVMGALALGLAFLCARKIFDL